MTSPLPLRLATALAWLGRPVALTAILPLTAGCGAPSSSAQQGDAQAYRRVLTDAGLDTATALAQCACLQEDALRGDCVVYLAGRRGQDDAVSAADLCGAAPEGMWRDECWFVSAETARRGRRRKDAAAMCLKAGRFTNDCGQHLWQSEVRAVIAPGRRQGHRHGGVVTRDGVASTAAAAQSAAPTPTFAEALPRAQLVYDRWEPLLAGGTDFSVRFWRRFYQNGFERRGWIDLQRCEGLPADKPAELPVDHSARCVDAAVKLMWARIDQDLRGAGVNPCALALGVGPVSQQLRVTPARAFDQALVDWQIERCGGPPRAVEP